MVPLHNVIYESLFGVPICHGLYQSKCGIGGPVHIAVGTLGSNSNCRSFLQQSLDRKHLSKSEDSHVVTVHNATALHWQFFANVDGKVLEDVWLYKDGGE